jgi:hypothetical protein
MRAVRVSAVMSVVVVLAATLVSLPASARSPEDRAALKGVSLQVSSTTVAKGHKVRLSGVAPVRRGATVIIRQLTLSTGRWSVEGTSHVGAGGRFHYSEVVHSGDRVYKACVTKGGREQCSKGRRVNLVSERHYSITIHAGAASYQAGQQVSVSGSVKPAATGAPVRLVRGDSEGAGAQTVAHSKIHSGGTYGFSVPAEAGTWTYWVTKPKTAVGAPSHSKAIVISVGKAGVVLAVSSVAPTTLEAGQLVTVSGASMNLVGQTVYLQAYDAATSKFGSIGSAVVDPAGNWSISAPILQAGKAVQLQVVAPETATTAAGGISAGSVAVYGWYYLYDNGPLDEVAGDWSEGSFAVNGGSYAKSVSLGVSSSSSTDFGEANLGRSCIRLVAVLGLADDSDTTVRYTASVMADAVTLYTHGGIALGQSFPIDVNLTNGLRLRLEATKTSGNFGYDDLVFGDARALCAF